MKKITLTFVSLVLVITFIIAQTPQAFKYQAVARNSSGTLITNQLVAFRITVLQGGPSGTMIYQERQTYTTNNYGLANLEIGKGTVLYGTFNTINWSLGLMFMKVELDPAGGTTYLVMGTTELLSVPYSLYSRTSSEGWNVNGNGGTNPSTNFIGTNDSISLNIKVNSKRSAWIDINAKNTSLGYKSLLANTTGYDNASLGAYTLTKNLGGYGNTAAGYGALYSNTSGYYNTAGGFAALNSNQGGNSNTAFGVSALQNTSTGYQNTAVGMQTLNSNTSGFENTAVGYGALWSNNANSRSTAIGFAAMYNANNTASSYPTFNTAIGVEALKGSSSISNNTGKWNTALGDKALMSNSSGNGNVAAGHASLQNNTTGSSNAVYGANTLQANINGSENSALGSWALISNISGNTNTAVGYSALYTNTTGNSNVAIGYKAGYNETGSNKLYIDNSETSTPLIWGDFNTNILNVNGRMGIGNSNPDAKLTIGNPGATYSDYGITSDSRICVVNGSGDRGAMIMKSGGTYGILGAYNYATNTTMPLVLEPDGGNVGINNLGPVYKLDIYNTNLGNSAGNTSAWQRLAGSSGNYDQLRVFHRRYAAGSSWTSAEIRIQKTVDATDQNFISFKGASTTSVGSLAFGFGNTEHMLINSSGKVGIGTLSPTSNLEVYGGNVIPSDPPFEADVLFKLSYWPTLLQKYAMLFDYQTIQTYNSPLYLNSKNANDVNIADGGGDVLIAEGGGDVLIASGGGNVGIGTESPTSKLDVRGNLTIREASTGVVAVELGTGLDYAEGFNVSDEMSAEPGTVLCIDPTNEGELRISAEAYDYRVAGIVAGANGLGSGIKLGSGEFDYDVALAGRVYCNVITTNDEITAGDLLTTSDVPGYAMKVRDFDKAKGAILGKAMESLEKNSKGQILVLVTLQ
jgi:hypothetical protein